MSPRKRTRPTPDGRANNGGPVTGTVGTTYPNRTDLTQAPTAARNQPYGQAGQQIAAQRAVPLPAAPPVQGAPGSPPGGGAAGPFARPSDTPSLTDPSQRPDEPLEAGLPFGPGPGPQQGPAPMSDVEARLRALYSAYPTPELRDLIRQADMGR